VGNSIIDEGYGGNVGVVMFNFCKEKFKKER
jgi:dUTPase